MVLGVMQPYLFPHFAYFDLIASTDQWVVFDTPQYPRHGWVNRNRILHPESGWQYFNVPLQKHSMHAAINEVRISDNQAWRSRIIGQLQHYSRRAPFFKDVIELVEQVIGTDTRSIVELNIRCLEKVCAYLDITFRPRLFSEMQVDVTGTEGPGDWALLVARHVAADEYVNPPGGADLFDRKAFESAGIKLTIRETPDFKYQTPGYDFEPSLSIIDVMLWNTPSVISGRLARARH